MNTTKKFFKENNEFYRNYSKGKSFAFTKWSPAVEYKNDLFKQDFVTYNGDLYACIKTNVNESPDQSSSWYLVINKLLPITFVPFVDENGNLIWKEREGNELPTNSNIMGPKGDKGEKGEKGDKGDRGDKGESGNGNFEIGNGDPLNNGYENDVYLDMSSGTFYVYNKEWKEKGQISIGGGSVELLWQDE